MPARLIVAIDDEACLLDLYTEVLQDEGYRVVTCAAKADAIPCVQRELPDVVILDLWLDLPGDGWEVYAALARDPTTAMIPIIVCTGTDNNKLQPPAELYASPVAILHKPFLLDDLLGGIETALARAH